jgi:hypothetical protein
MVQLLSSNSRQNTGMMQIGSWGEDILFFQTKVSHQHQVVA